ncbi:hypothetical protein DENSPDRAFT_149029 [Dentipellis sp. KUC8613]|nr:hypothetical protein DENSPDRAFT_149029 [Dentipellis sp. KUC8613]
MFPFVNFKSALLPYNVSTSMYRVISTWRMCLLRQARVKPTQAALPICTQMQTRTQTLYHSQLRQSRNGTCTPLGCPPADLRRSRKQYGDHLEQLVLSGELFTGASRSSSPARTPSPSTSWPELSDDEDARAPAPALADDAVPPIGMGPRRTGVMFGIGVGGTGQRPKRERKWPQRTCRGTGRPSLMPVRECRQPNSQSKVWWARRGRNCKVMSLAASEIE